MEADERTTWTTDKQVQGDEFEYNQIVRGITALVGDHMQRGRRYAGEEGLLRPGRQPSTWVLHELGACLAFQQMLADGTLACLAFHSGKSAAFYDFALKILAKFLYAPTAHMQLTPMGDIGWSVVCFRFMHEDCWSGCASQGGRFFEASDCLNDDAVHALAELLWAKRDASIN